MMKQDKPMKLNKFLVISISYLLSNKFLNFLKIQDLKLLHFQIFENLWCIAVNYKKNETVIKKQSYCDFLIVTLIL